MMVRFKEELVKALTRARLKIEEAKPEEGKTDPKVSMNLKLSNNTFVLFHRNLMMMYSIVKQRTNSKKN